MSASEGLPHIDGHRRSASRHALESPPDGQGLRFLRERGTTTSTVDVLTPRRIVVFGDLAAPGAYRRIATTLPNFLADFSPDEVHSTHHQNVHVDGGDPYDARLVKAVRSSGFAGPIRLQHSGFRSDLIPTRGRNELYDLGVTEILGPRKSPDNFVIVSAAGAVAWRYPGVLAIRLARIYQATVVVGGTRSLSMIADRGPGRHDDPSAVGIEVGTLLDIASAQLPMWQRGFVILSHDEQIMTATLIPIESDGSFAFGGTVYAP